MQKSAIFNVKYEKSRGIYNIINLKTDEDFTKILKDVFQLEKIELKIKKEKLNYAFDIIEPITIIFDKNSQVNNFYAKTEKPLIILKSKPNHYLMFDISGRNNIYFLLHASLTVYILKKNKYEEVMRATFYKKIDEAIPYNLNFNNNTKFHSENSSEPNGNSIVEINNVNKSEGNLFSNDISIIYSDINMNNIPILAKKISSTLFGLKNLGNTCFLNSTLQILVHSPLFVENFLTDINKIKPHYDTLAYALYNFLINVYSNEKKTINPSNLIDAFLKKCTLFSLGEQSDSIRFFRNLLTILQKELGFSNTCIKNTLEGTIRNINAFNCQSTYCGTRNEIENKQQFFNIFISCSEEAKEPSINDLIKNTYKLKIQESNKICECGCNMILKRETYIYPNKYLVVNIQKANISTRTLKNTKIKLDDICLNINKKIFYEPYAINFHYGNLDYGHYYSYVKIYDNKNYNKDGEWYCFNDEKYQKTNFPKVSDNVLNVFYKLKSF